MKTSIITALTTLALSSVAQAQGDPLGADPFARPRADRDAIETQPRRVTDRAWLVPEGTVAVRADGDLAHLAGNGSDTLGAGRLHAAVGLTRFLDLGVSGETQFAREARGDVQLSACVGTRAGPIDLQFGLRAGPAELGGKEVVFSAGSELDVRYHIIEGVVIDAGAFLGFLEDEVSSLGGHAGLTVSPTEAWWFGGQVAASAGGSGAGRVGLTAGHVFTFDDVLLDVGASVAYLDVGASGVQAGLTATLWMPVF